MKKNWENLIKQMKKLGITDKATCLLVMGRIKTTKQYQQMMDYLTKQKNLTKAMITDKAIAISKN